MPAAAAGRLGRDGGGTRRGNERGTARAVYGPWSRRGGAPEQLGGEGNVEFTPACTLPRTWCVMVCECVCVWCVCVGMYMGMYLVHDMYVCVVPKVWNCDGKCRKTGGFVRKLMIGLDGFSVIVCATSLKVLPLRIK